MQKLSKRQESVLSIIRAAGDAGVMIDKLDKRTVLSLITRNLVRRVAEFGSHRNYVRAFNFGANPECAKTPNQD